MGSNQKETPPPDLKLGELSEENLVLAYTVRLIGVIACAGFPFIGAAYGIMSFVPGIVKSAEIRVDVTSVVTALIFIASSPLYAFIIFFVMNSHIQSQKYLHQVFRITSCGLMMAITNFIPPYAFGVINRYLLPAKLQQPKFGLIFILTNIFMEIVSLMGFVLCFLLLRDPSKQEENK